MLCRSVFSLRNVIRHASPLQGTRLCSALSDHCFYFRGSHVLLVPCQISGTKEINMCCSEEASMRGMSALFVLQIAAGHTLNSYCLVAGSLYVLPPSLVLHLSPLRPLYPLSIPLCLSCTCSLPLSLSLVLPLSFSDSPSLSLSLSLSIPLSLSSLACSLWLQPLACSVQ